MIRIKNLFRKILAWFRLKRVVKKVRSDVKFVGTMRKKPGLSLFAYDRDVDVVYQVKFYNNKAFLQKGHPVVWAINLKNAIRKLKK